MFYVDDQGSSFYTAKTLSGPSAADILALQTEFFCYSENAADCGAAITAFSRYPRLPALSKGSGGVKNAHFLSRDISMVGALLRHGRLLTVAAWALWGVGPVVSAGADPQVVDLQLVLAVDISASMSFAEQKIQREGYADALRDPAVIAAIMSGPTGRVAVTYVEWAEFEYTAIQWTVVDGPATAERLAAKLQRLPFHRETGTSISRALHYTSALFNRGRFTSERRTIDISGDGPNNIGPSVTAMRDKVVARGITINGLPIVFEGSISSESVDLDLYYRTCVIGGPGAFTMPVRSIDELAGTIRMKLLQEILVAEANSFIVRTAAESEFRPIDCTKGQADGK